MARVGLFEEVEHQLTWSKSEWEQRGVQMADSKAASKAAAKAAATKHKAAAKAAAKAAGAAPARGGRAKATVSGGKVAGAAASPAAPPAADCLLSQGLENHQSLSANIFRFSVWRSGVRGRRPAHRSVTT